jgi:hypothetical protein
VRARKQDRGSFCGSVAWIFWISQADDLYSQILAALEQQPDRDGLRELVNWPG